jgi:hypothetical protein
MSPKTATLPKNAPPLYFFEGQCFIVQVAMLFCRFLVDFGSPGRLAGLGPLKPIERDLARSGAIWALY